MMDLLTIQLQLSCPLLHTHATVDLQWRVIAPGLVKLMGLGLARTQLADNVSTSESMCKIEYVYNGTTLIQTQEHAGDTPVIIMENFINLFTWSCPMVASNPAAVKCGLDSTVLPESAIPRNLGICILFVYSKSQISGNC